MCTVRVVAWEAPTLCFSSTSEAKLEVQNGEVETRWYLSSFAPPYVKVHFYLYYITSSLSFLFIVSFSLIFGINVCHLQFLLNSIVINVPHEFASNTVIFFNFFCFTHTHCILLLALKHWFIFSSQGVDSTGGVYRATYSAFRCSGVSGTLGAHEKMLVGVYDHLDCPQFLNNNQKEFLIIKLFC